MARPPIRKRYLVALAALVLLLLALGRAVIREPAYEEARRFACRVNLLAIDRALAEYREAEGTLPATLAELVRRGLLPENALYCPSGGEIGATTRSEYLDHPEAWGTVSPLVTEDCRNHMQRSSWLTRLFGVELSSACYALFSDGSMRDMAGAGEMVTPPDPRRGRVGSTP